MHRKPDTDRLDRRWKKNESEKINENDNDNLIVTSLSDAELAQ